MPTLLSPTTANPTVTEQNTVITCPDPFAKLLLSQGYTCLEKYWKDAQTCYVFERDPWESQIVIRMGRQNNGFNDYCQTGDIAPIA